MFRVYLTIGVMVLCLNSCKGIDTDNGATSRVDGLQIERDNQQHGNDLFYERENNGKGSIACPAGHAEKGLC